MKVSGLSAHAQHVPLELRTGLVLSGLTAVVAQIVLIRELLVVVYGNELSIGIAMAFWLLWTAVGSGWLGRIGHLLSGRSLTAVLLILESPALFASLLLIHSSRHWWNAVSGESLSPVQVIAIAATALALFCPIAGWLFTAGARAYTEESRCVAEDGGSTMYLLEVVGSACGGILASIIFFRLFDSFQIAALLSAANVLIAVWLLCRAKALRTVASAAVVASAICGIMLFPRLQLRLMQSAWPGFHTVATANSRYGTIAVLESEGTRSVLQNGRVLFTVPDPAAAEEAVHFPLLEHNKPSSILMISGGLNGSIAEVLRHPSVTHIDYVELDPTLLKIAQQYLPQAWQTIASEPRVHVHSYDGRLFMRSTDQRFDVIIVNVPEPETAQLNRFYTEEFFAEAAARLNAGGILALHLRGAEEYISPGRAEFLASIYQTLRRVFPEVIAIPGEDTPLLASSNPAALETDPRILLSRLRERRVQTSYMREYYLPTRMAKDRIAGLREQLAGSNHRINRDFAPSAYYFSIGLWGAQFSNAFRAGFRSAAQVKFSTVLDITGAGTLLLLILFSARRDPQRRAENAARLAITSSGLILMGVEIILLLGFEAIYGYVFDEIAVIVASFMSGMALGSWMAIRQLRVAAVERRRGLLLLIQIALTVLPASVVALLWVFNGARGYWTSLVVAHLVFPAIAAACGVVGGYQFPIALSFTVRTAHASGILYGCDLLGAAVGAIALSTYLLPVFGFLNTALIISVPSISAIVLIYWSEMLTEVSPPSVGNLKTRAL